MLAYPFKYQWKQYAKKGASPSHSKSNSISPSHSKTNQISPSHSKNNQVSPSPGLKPSPSPKMKPPMNGNGPMVCSPVMIDGGMHIQFTCVHVCLALIVGFHADCDASIITFVARNLQGYLSATVDRYNNNVLLLQLMSWFEYKFSTCIYISV